jgi:hypothetical protein
MSISIPLNLLRTACIALFAMACCVAQIGSSAELPRAIYDAAKKSAFLIETFDSKGIPLSLGTGFAVRSNYLASNCHVLRGASRATAKNLASGQSFSVEAVVATDLGRDLVVMRIEASVPSLVIDTNLSWSVGDSVYALGNPRGLEGTFSAGIISATRKLDNVEYIQITAPISPGSSGGPILSSEGKVVGVATSAMREAQNLNFAVSALHLSALLTGSQRNDSLSGFVANQEDFSRKQKPVLNANGGEILVKSFEWTDEDSFRLAGSKFESGFSFTIYNGLNRPIRDVLVIVSFLDANSEPVETKSIRIGGTIGSQSARRANASVDGSVYKLNKLRDPQYPKVDDEGAGKTEYLRAFMPDTNSIKVKWQGKLGDGFKPTYSINGKPAAKADYERLFAETAAKLRVMRALTFEFVD